jgi:MFS family permease
MKQVVTLGLSLFVLGFAVGPLAFALLSEILGCQILFYLTDGALAIFNTGAACSQNIQTLRIIRSFAGAFGSSPLANAGGRIADMFGQRLVRLAMSLFVTAPFIGLALCTSHVPQKSAEAVSDDK